MKTMISNLQVLVLSTLACQPLPVRSTWSIVAIDKTTHQMGSAMATCLDNDDFPDNARDFLDHGFIAVPCQGAIIAQASIQDETGPVATVGVPLLEAGSTAAQDIVAAISTPQADPGSILYQTAEGELELSLLDIRQYGIVTYNETDPVASYTGPQLTTLYRAVGFDTTEETSESIAIDNYTASVQGNIIFPGTVAATAAAFRNSTACGFAELLFDSLKQGYLETGGDVRCANNPGTKGAVLAYLKVVEPDGTYSINLEARLGLSDNASALDAIETGLMAWRQDNPCIWPQHSPAVCGDNNTSPPSAATSQGDNNHTDTEAPTPDNASSATATTCLICLPLFGLTSLLI